MPRMKGKKKGGEDCGPCESESPKQERECADGEDGGDVAGKSEYGFLELEAFGTGGGTPERERKPGEKRLQDVVAGPGEIPEGIVPIAFLQSECVVSFFTLVGIATEDDPAETVFFVIPETEVETLPREGCGQAHGGEDEEEESPGSSGRGDWQPGLGGRDRAGSQPPGGRQSKKNEEHTIDRSRPPEVDGDKVAGFLGFPDLREDVSGFFSGQEEDQDGDGSGRTEETDDMGRGDPGAKTNEAG